MDRKATSIRQTFRRLRSRWYYFLVALLIALPLAYLYNKLAPQQHRIKAALLLRSEPSAIQPGGFLPQKPRTAIADEIGILQSNSIVEKTIRELDFGVSYFTKKDFVTQEKYGNSPFTIEIDSVVSQAIAVPVYIELISSTRYKVTVSGKNVSIYNPYTNQVEDVVQQIDLEEEVPLGKPYKNKYLSFTVKFNAANKVDRETKSFFVLQRIQTLTDSYRRKLSIEPISSESFIVELTLTGNVAEKEMTFLNKLLDVYLQNELYKENQLGLKTIQFIDNQLYGPTDTVGPGNGSQELFRSSNGILESSGTVNLTKNLRKLEVDKVNLENKLKYYRFLGSSLQQENGVAKVLLASSLGVSDAALNSLLMDLSKLNQERIALSNNLRENAALVEIIDSKINNSKKTLADHVTQQIQSTTDDLTDLNNKVFRIQKTIDYLPKDDRELINVQRGFTINDNVYDYLLQKRTEAGIAIASNSVEKTIVDKPYQVGDGPVFPNRILVFILAGLGAVIAASVFIILKDILNDNIITVEDVEQHTKIPLIGTIGHADKREQSSIVAHARSSVGESFRSLRVNLQYLTLGKNANVIGITSSRESEGKTFCSVNLGAVMAYSGRRTVLVDTDMRRPRVAAYFQLENRKGLSNFLVGDCTIKEIINNTEHKGFDVIGSGPIPPNPIDLIGNARMEELIETLKQTYSTIILDSPPLGYVSEYIILMKYTDANLYIVRSDYTNRTSLSKVNKLFERKKMVNVSVLLNDVKATKNSGYVYGYGYKY